MTETEGVIKFNLEFSEGSHDADVRELSAWRSILKDLGLLGQTPTRYDGYGFGNVSIRTAGGFLISGTQTGHLDHVTQDDYAFCDDWDVTMNRVRAKGRIKPSSESLSHAAIYDVYGDADCALHVHSPEIWRQAQALGIPITAPSVPYGTPEMAVEVRRVLENRPLPGIFSMGGHEDGVFTFGRTLTEAGELLIATLAAARAAGPEIC